MRLIGLLMFVIACGEVDKQTETPVETKAPVTAEKIKEPTAATEAETKEKGDTKHGDKAHDQEHGVVAEPGAVPEGAKVFFVEPADGAKVKSPVKVKMGIEGMIVQAAGEIVEGTGHHHIIIDSPSVPRGTAVQADDKHVHFGKGQKETELTLAAGEHKIQLQFANGAHISYGPQLSTEITITVEE